MALSRPLSTYVSTVTTGLAAYQTALLHSSSFDSLSSRWYVTSAKRVSAADAHRVHVVDPCSSNTQIDPSASSEQSPAISISQRARMSKATAGVIVTATLAEYITGVKVQDCSSTLLERAKKVIVDTVGVTVAGMVHPQVQKVARFVKMTYDMDASTSKPGSGCSIPTHNFKTTPDRKSYHISNQNPSSMQSNGVVHIIKAALKNKLCLTFRHATCSAIQFCCILAQPVSFL